MEQIPPPSSETVSSQKSLPSSYDSGWNDPPEWAMSSQRSSFEGTSNKRLLNKRVAFPLSSQTSASGTTSPSLPSNMPPISQSFQKTTTAPHKPLVTPIGKDTVTKSSESDFDKSQALTKVMANLESVMMEQKIEKNKLEEIQKRLSIMRSDWLEDKLNDTVQRNILDMSEGKNQIFPSICHSCRLVTKMRIYVLALLSKDVQQADKIHIKLMMQHATVCHTWMPAVRHIILELKKKSEVSQVKHLQSPLLSVEPTKKSEEK